jgi:hypothetical protein
MISPLARAHFPRPLRNVGTPRPIPPGILLIHQTLSPRLEPKVPTMTIEIRDASLEARIQKQLQATGSASVEEVLLRLLDTQEEQDRWLRVRACMRGETALGL